MPAAETTKTLIVVSVYGELAAWIAARLKPGETIQEVAGEYLQAGVECARNHKNKG